MGPAPTSLDDVIMEMVRLQRALPPRPSFPELELALSTINNVNDTLAAKEVELLQQPRPVDVLPSVFDALQEMRREILLEQAQEQKRSAEAVILLEQRHRRYDGWIQQAYNALAPLSHNGSSTLPQQEDQKQSLLPAKVAERKTAKTGSEIEWDLLTSEGSVTSASQLSSAADDNIDKSSQITYKLSTSARVDSFSSLARSSSWSSLRGETQVPQPRLTNREEKALKTSLASLPDGKNLQATVNVLSMLDLATKRKQKSLDLHGAFLKEIEWVPESLGRLTWLTDLNLSGNCLTVLPDAIGDLCNLINLDVSANQLIAIPESIGRLTCLEILNIEKNKIEELPWTIGQCTALVELNAGFNQLKALPEATGKLSQLRCLYVHLNSLKSLPTTIAFMTSLTDLDAHFNQLESIPESLCQVTTLTILNVASNFTDLKELPQQIGKLQKLKVLNISFNHLTVLPDSFAMLTNLQDLDLEGNPLRLPPLHVAEQGKEAVLKYMADYMATKENGKSKKRKGTILSRLLFTCGKPRTDEEEFMA